MATVGTTAVQLYPRYENGRQGAAVGGLKKVRGGVDLLVLGEVHAGLVEKGVPGRLG